MAESVHTGHRQRVKEEFLVSGFDGWSDHRILEFLLFYAAPRGDVNELAHQLIHRFSSLNGVLDAPYDQLIKVNGVGEHAATLIKAMPAISAVYMGSRATRDITVNCAAEAVSLFARHFVGKNEELVYVLCLDGKNKVLGLRQIATGSIRAVNINLRRIMEEVVSLHAAKIYLAHNHVGSLPLPSTSDWNSTLVAYGALDAVGIELVDHLVFQDDEMVSLRESQTGSRPFFPM